MAQQQLPGIVAECSEVHTCQASQLAQPLTFWQAIRRAAPEIDVYHWFGRSLVITVLVPCWYRVGTVLVCSSFHVFRVSFNDAVMQIIHNNTMS